MTGEIITRWTIRLALVAYVAALAAMLQAWANRRARDQVARSLWSAACVLLWVHVACAFHFYHNWIHSAAWDQTARETYETTGLNWGGGVWFNYLLMVAWAGDAAWWWISPHSYRERPRAISATVHAFIAFMAFNATVVFETGPVRWAGMAAATLLAGLGARCYWQRPDSVTSPLHGAAESASLER